MCNQILPPAVLLRVTELCTDAQFLYSTCPRFSSQVIRGSHEGGPADEQEDKQARAGTGESRDFQNSCRCFKGTSQVGRDGAGIHISLGS